MEKKKKEIFFNSMFECDSFSCCCQKDIENLIPGEKPNTRLKLFSDQSQPLHFSYMAKEGLNLTGLGGRIIEKNILGKLLALPADDIDGHINFFNTYGFFNPLSFDEYSSINCSSILEITNRIKATIRLMNALGKCDYNKMLIHVSYLLFSDPIKYNACGKEYQTYVHPFTNRINCNNFFPDLSNEREIQATGQYSVYDSIINDFSHISFEFINAIRSGKGCEISGSKSKWFKSIVALYLSGRNKDDNLNLIIDFFYHLFTENGVYREVAFSKITTFEKLNIDNFTDKMKKALIKISQIIIAETINFNIKDIHPKFNPKNLSASWQINTLLEAIYFSIFYMKPGTEIYKECENPNCKRDKYFLVETTRSNKKYCCQQCANAAAARRHRNRHL